MRVRFEPYGKSAEARADETLLDVARRAGVPIGNSCGGVGVCARCRIEVVDGNGNLTPPTTTEARAGAARQFAPGERLACQAVVLGDCSITASYW